MPNPKQVILAISIAIIFALFIGFGINTFYQSPDRDDYCKPELYRSLSSTEEECLALNGTWVKNQEIPSPEPRPVKLDNGSAFSGFCNLHEKCNSEYEAVAEIYNKNLFIIASIIGIIAVILGVVIKNSSVGNGLMSGGILTILYGVIRYWQFAADLLRFIILGIILIILIWIGYKKLKK